MELVPGNSLITKTPEEGRALALTLARHSIHALQPDEAVLKGGRPKYSTDPGLIDRGLASRGDRVCYDRSC